MATKRAPRAATRRTPRPPKPQIHVAVVVRNLMLEISELVKPGEVWSSQRGRGDWASFVGTDRDAVIHEAQAAVERWGPQYVIWVGTLTGLVIPPKPRYEVRPL